MARTRSTKPAKTKTATRSRSTRSAPRSRKADILFTKDSVVAIPGSDYRTNFRLVKLKQDVSQSSKDIKVTYLKLYEDEIVQLIFYDEEVQGTIQSKDIIGEGDVLVYKKKLKKKEPTRTCYELKNTSHNQLKKIAANFSGASKAKAKAEESEEESSEDESDEEEEEEEEEKPKTRQVRKVTGKKEAKEDEIEEEASPTPRRSTRSTRNQSVGKAAEKEEVSRVTKKQKTSPKKSKATKKEDIEAEEEEEEEEEEKEEEKPKGKGKGKKAEKEETKEEKGKGKGKKKAAKDDEMEEEEVEETPKKRGRKKKGEEEEDEEEGEPKKKGRKKKAEGEKKEKKKPAKFKKGKWNPDVVLVTYDDVAENPSEQPIDQGPVRYNARNLVRAVNTGNYKLLENCGRDRFVTGLFDSWSPDDSTNALTLAFRKNDKKAIQVLCKVFNRLKHYAYQPTGGLQQTSTGNQSIFAFGVAVRQVEMGRGGRELTNAYVKDPEPRRTIDETIIREIISLTSDTSLLDLLKVEMKGDPAQGIQGANVESMLNNQLEHIVSCGNYKVASYLVNSMRQHHGFGATETHLNALTFTDPKKFDNGLRNTSVTSKIYGSNITPIHFASINPNPKILEFLLSKAPEYSITDLRMRKPVHYAAACESPEPLKLLLKYNVDFREGDRLKVTPLMIACEHGRLENVEIFMDLLKKEPGLMTQKNKEGNLPIHIATEQGHLDIVKLLHKNGADLNAAGKSRMTPLIIAAAKGYHEMVQWLVENGGKIIKKDKFKRNPLHLACINGHVKIASYLLQYGAEFNQADSSNITCMHYAAAYGFPQLIQILKDAGADQNAPDAQKLTPLTVAMLKNNNVVMDKLFSYPDTDVNCKDDQGRSLIMMAIASLNEAKFKQIEFLLNEKKADANIEDINGMSALHYICQIDVNSLANSDWRLQGIQNITERHDKKEEILLELTSLQERVIKLLLDHKAEINHKAKNGSTPFFVSLQRNNFRVCDLLLENPSLDLTSIDNKDQGIYHLLAKIIFERDALESFESLIEKVQNKNDLLSLVDDEGFTPFLRIMHTIAHQGTNAFQKIKTYIREEKIAEKQRAFDVKQGKVPAKKKQEESASKAGAKKGAKTPAMSTGGKGVFANISYSQDSRPVSLDYYEEQQVVEEAEIALQETLEQIIDICKKLISLGAKSDAIVQKLKKFRGEKGRKSVRTPDALIEKALGKSHGHHQHHHVISKKGASNEIEYGAHGYQNAVHIIQAFPNPSVLRFLLENQKLDVNHADHVHRTPLHYFISSHISTSVVGFKVQTLDILNIILDAGANVNATDGLKDTPLIITIQKNNFNYVDPLLKKGANINAVNAAGDTPLIICTKRRALGQVEQLLALGADTNFTDQSGRTALHHALNISKTNTDASFELEETLLRHGADINAKDSRNRTPLHYAFVSIGKPFEFSAIDPIEVVTSLCSNKNCDANVKDQFGSTPLHYAAQRGALVCCLTLIKKGVDVNAQDEDGNTPLGIALHAKHSDVAIMLIQSDADVTKDLVLKKKELTFGPPGKGGKKDNNDNKMEIEKSPTALKASKIVSEEEEEEEQEEPEEGGSDEMEIEPEEPEEVSPNDEDPDRFIGGFDEENEEEAIQIEENEDNGTEGMGDDEEPEEEDEDIDIDEDEEHYDEEEYDFVPVHTSRSAGNLLDIPEGTYSLFTVAIKREYQGVAYLLLQHKFNLNRAIQDCINERKFSYVWTLLSKVKDASLIRGANDQGQNLYHTLALKGRDCPHQELVKIHSTFMDKKIDFQAQDKLGRTPLHYAALKDFFFVFKELLANGADVNVQDNDGHTPFTLQLTHTKTDLTSYMALYIAHGANFNSKFKVKISEDDENEMGPLTYLISKGVRSIDTLKLLLSNGVSVNETDENGYSALIYAIRQNSKKLVKFLLNYPDLDKKHKDNDGKTPIHHVVNPVEYGSYENTAILEVLAPHFDLNEVDEFGKSPIYYAYLQDSGVMAAKLRELGATDNKPPANVQRAATSVTGTLSWPDEEIPYEEDAEKYMENVKKAEKEKMEEEGTDIVQPDQFVANKAQFEVVYDPVLGPYDLYMTKVDLSKGLYGGNLFYRMQVLRNKVRDFYQLSTRYGRIGESGQYQATPFPDKETCIKEFCKIFKSKSGNEWEDKENFKRESGKYKLLKYVKKTNYKEHLVPFDLTNPKVPASAIDQEIRKIMKDVTNVHMYQEMMHYYHIDTSYFTVSNLEKSLLFEAQHILLELQETIKEVEAEEKKDLDNKDVKKLLELKEKIIDHSNKFYELIPDTKFKTAMVQPLENSADVLRKLKMIEDLLDFEVSSKIMLGALLQQYKVNPLDYCFKALNVKMLGLSQNHPEFQMIKQYISASRPNISDEFIVNIFALERKGEAERISQWKHLKNKTLLWHGSKLYNFMGILSGGLRIPQAPVDGGFAERGVFFADMFSVSYGYCGGSAGEGKYKLLLLCEVALGEIYETNKTEWEVDMISDPYKSVKACGSQGPKANKKIVMPNGCVVPIGKVVNYKFKQGEEPTLGQSEYIVYDVSQIRVRYLVQVK